MLRSAIYAPRPDCAPTPPAPPITAGAASSAAPPHAINPHVLGVAAAPGQSAPVRRWPAYHAPGIGAPQAHVLPRKVMEFAEAQRFRFGAAIQASDGVAGSLVMVVVDEQRRASTHLGIRMSPFHRHVVLVSVDRVTDATADTVTLSIPQDRIARDGPTVMPSGIALTRSTRVSASGAPRNFIGHLVQVSIHREAHELHHLVAARRLHGTVLVLASLITGITPRDIAVSLTGVPPEQLVRYRPDEELRRNAYDRLYDYAPLRIDLSGIAIYALDGGVWLRGHVSSDGKRRLAEHQLRDLVGMFELHNELVADEELAAAVAMALAHDPRTAGQHIGVYPQLGDTYLRGSVQTRAARTGAGDGAAGVAGVKGVMNELRVDPHAGAVPALASVSNREEMVPGGR